MLKSLRLQQLKTHLSIKTNYFYQHLVGTSSATHEDEDNINLRVEERKLLFDTNDKETTDEDLTNLLILSGAIRADEYFILFDAQHTFQHQTNTP